MARHIREAMKRAILSESSHVHLDEDADNHAGAARSSAGIQGSGAGAAAGAEAASHLRAHDFGAIDRTLRCPYIEEKAEGMRPGMRSSYAPGVFRALRAHFGVTEDAFCASVIDNPLIPAAGSSTDAAASGGDDASTSSGSGSGGGGGRSGAVFFFSADRHFVVKSVSKSEAKLARQLLPSYLRHVTSYPDSLLPRLYLLIKVAVGTRSQDVIRVMVTQNVFNMPADFRLGLQFDLKGSTANRWVSAKEQIKYATSEAKKAAAAVAARARAEAGAEAEAGTGAV